MNEFVFRNKWVLLATAILMHVGVSLLVGREDDKGMLAQTQSDADNLSAQRAPANVAPPAPTVTQDESASDDDGDSYADAGDDDQIDNAQGDDPSPPDDQSSGSAGDPPPPDAQAQDDSGNVSGSDE